MKKLLSSLLILLFTFSLFNTNAQKWVSMMKDPKVNVHDVQKAFYAWYLKQPGGKKHLKELRSRKHEAKETGADEALMQFKRWEYFYTKRTFPSGNRPDPVVMEKEYNSFLGDRGKSKTTHQTTTAANWTYVGNTSVPSGGGGDGRVAHIRFDPNNANIVYACTPSGGLWKSTNGGTSWSTNTDKLIDLAVNDIAINPLKTNIMYMATGDGDAAYATYTPTTVGVLKSFDGGTTWQPSGLYYNISMTGPSISTFNELLLNPVDTNVLFCATTAGVFLSTNSGSYWTNVLPGVQAYDIQYEPGNYKVVYVSTLDGQFYRSSNSGASFTQITSGLPSAMIYARMEIGVSPANPAYVYILAADSASGGFVGLYQSTDTGKTFTTKSTSPDILGWNSNGSGAGGQGWYDLTIAVSPSNATTLFIGGVDIWESTNGGANWSNKSDWTSNGSNYVHADVHHLTFANGSSTTIWAAGDGGVFLSANTGTSWTDMSNNLEIAQQYGVGPSSLTTNLWLTGWQDNGTELTNGVTWSQTVGGDGTQCFIDYTNDNNMYASYPYGTLYYSTNGGNTWGNGGNGISDNGPWITPWVEDTKTPNTIYAGFSNIWKSTNQAKNFSKISSWASSSYQITAIADGQNLYNSWIYACTDSLIYYTSNGGTTWTNITGTLPTNNAGMYAIAISPNHPYRAWVTFSGYSANDKVYETKDAGATWTNMSAGLPNLPVNCIVYQPNSADGIYVGTDQGIYYHDTIINTWVDYSNNLPNTVVQDLKISKKSGNLLAATFGRGTWQSATYTSPTAAPVANFSGFPTTFCVGDTVQFTDLSTNQPNQWSWTFTGGSPSSSTVQNPTIGYLSSGVFPVSLTATNTHGNNTSTVAGYITVNADPATPVITQTTNTLTCTPNSMSSYQWYFNSLMIPGANSSIYTQSPSLPIGTYSVVITNSSGCSSVGSLPVVSTNTAVVSNNEYVTIYPNPSNGAIGITCNLPEGNYSLSVDNIIGQTVLNQKMHISGTYNTNLNLTGFGSGVYLLNIQGENTKVVKKLVVY